MPEVWLKLGHAGTRRTLVGFIYREHKPWKSRDDSVRGQEERLKVWLEARRPVWSGVEETFILGDLSSSQGPHQLVITRLNHSESPVVRNKSESILKTSLSQAYPHPSNFLSSMLLLSPTPGSSSSSSARHPPLHHHPPNSWGVVV